MALTNPNNATNLFFPVQLLLLLTSWHLRTSLSLIVPNPHRRQSYIPCRAIRQRRTPFPLCHSSLCDNRNNDEEGYRRRRRCRGGGGPRGRIIRKGVSFLGLFQSEDSIGDDGGSELQDHATTQHSNSKRTDRRSFLERSALSITTTSFGTMALFKSSTTTNANARGLVRFPCTEPLSNTYHILRAGSSLLEVEDIWSTNPLFLTNREAALSEIGDEQVREACRYLKSTGSTPTVVRYSLAAASIDAANIVGEELNIGRDRLVPEFNYMDPRAIGGWDYAPLNATEEAVWAMDADTAGRYGNGGLSRPPPNEDGTPSETLADQVVRLTNLVSVLETLYSGDTVLLVFPDGTGPALLSCLIGGIPLNRVHELQFRPGEVRRNVDYASINALADRPPSQSYTDTLRRGRDELRQLRENPDMLRNVKDLKYEEELEQENLEREAMRKEEARAKEMERQRKEEGRLQREREDKERGAKRKEEAQAKESERQRKREERLRLDENEHSQNSSNAGSFAIAGSVVVGGAAVIFGLSGADRSEPVINRDINALDADIDRASLNSTANVHIPEADAEGPTDDVAVGEENATDVDIDEESMRNSTDPQIDSKANTTLTDTTPAEFNIDSLPKGAFSEDDLTTEDMDVSIDSDEARQNDVDYDDWGDAWLGSISEILDDANSEDN